MGAEQFLGGTPFCIGLPQIEFFCPNFLSDFLPEIFLPALSTIHFEQETTEITETDDGSSAPPVCSCSILSCSCLIRFGQHCEAIGDVRHALL